MSKRSYEELLQKIQNLEEVNAELTEVNAELTEVNAELTEVNAEVNAELTDVLRVNAELTEVNAEVNTELTDVLRVNAELTEEIMATSIYAAIVGGRDIRGLINLGTESTNMNSKTHDISSVTIKAFTLRNLIAAIDELKEMGIDPSFERIGSVLIPYINKKSQLSYHSEADVATYVNLALTDATTVCNELIKMVASTKSTKTMELFVRQEMSIFSNRCDHAVVYDLTSNASIFSVETKKHFGENFHQSMENLASGQCLDQLKAMYLMGHPLPLGALTCFNETYFTSLSPDIDWDALPTLRSLEDIVERLPGSVLPPNGTPPPPKMESPTSARTIRETASQVATTGFTLDETRCIIRSNKCITQDNLVSAFVIIILQALTACYVPKLFKQFTVIGEHIEVDCIRMTSKHYDWGKFCATYQGSFSSLNYWYTTLHLTYCIGNGSTSKVYYAITQEGYDCVVKMYVQSHYEDGTRKSSSKFKSDSKKYVKIEKDNYAKIYGNEVFVRTRQLNGFQCVIMPYFEPIKPKDRRAVLTSIKARLQKFAGKKMSFDPSDRKWRHVGRYQEKIFLFDLGDLKTCKTPAMAQTFVQEHLDSLESKIES